MKFLRHVLLPAAFVLMVLGAAYAIGQYQSRQLGLLDAPEFKAPHKPRQIIRHNQNPRTFITLEEAQHQVADILAGNLPPRARNAAMAISGIIPSLKPADAVALIATLTDPSQRQVAMRELANLWERDDVKATLAWADTLDPADEQFVLRAVLINYSSDPKIAAQYFSKLEDSSARNLALFQIERGLARTDPETALAWLNQTATSTQLPKYVTDLFQKLAGPASEVTQMAGGATMVSYTDGQSNPTAAVDLLSKISDPTLRTAGIGEIAKDWGNTDPAAAAKWAATLSGADSTAATAALNSIVTTWAKNDPEGALAFVQNSADPAQFLADAPALAQSLSKYDSAAALKFVQGLPDGATKDQAVNNVLVNVAGTDFPSAWTFATNLPEGAGRDAAMGSLIATQAKMDPAQAVNLLDNFSTVPALQNATRTLAKAWAAQDPQAASQWLQALPLGTQRNVGTVELITAVYGKDPASALQWADTITTPATRANQVQRIVTKWAAQDPAAALNALQSANITDDERATFAQAIDQAQAKAK